MAALFGSPLLFVMAVGLLLCCCLLFCMLSLPGINSLVFHVVGDVGLDVVYVDDDVANRRVIGLTQRDVLFGRSLSSEH